MKTQSKIQLELMEHETFVRRMASYLLSDPNEVDDLTQDVWMRAIQRDSFGSRGLRAWLGSTIRSLAGNRKRSAGRRAAHEAKAATEEQQSCPLEKWTSRQEVVQAVLELEEPFKTTVLLAYGEGLTPKQIAARESVPVGTVRSRLHRAHGKLRDVLAPDEDGRGRLFGLALMPAPGAKELATGTSLAATLKPALALLVIVVGGAGVWAWQAIKQPARSPAAMSPGSSFNAGGLNVSSPRPKMIALAAAEGQRESVGLDNTQAVGNPEHAFWQAVRSVRDASKPYVIEEPMEDAQLRLEIGRARYSISQQPLQNGVAEALKTMAIATGIPIEFHGSGRDILRDAGLSLQWAAPCELTVETALDILVGLSDQNLGWEIQGGKVHVAAWEDLLKKTDEHTFDYSDLHMDPLEYFELAHVPKSLFQPMLDIGVLAYLIEERFPGSWGDTQASIRAQGQSLIMKGSPRMLLQAQEFVEELRAFVLPLPEKGTPGKTMWLHRHTQDGRLVGLLNRTGARDRIFVSQGKDLKGDLERFGASNGIGVLWSRGAREHQGETARLRFSVLAGCLVVLDKREALRVPTQSYVWVDLRGVLTGGAPSDKQVNQDPLLSSMAKNGEALKLDRNGVVAFLQNRICPESWDEDPDNSMRVMNNAVLVLSQGPAVIEDFLQVIRNLE